MTSRYLDNVKFIAAIDVGEEYSGCAYKKRSKENRWDSNVSNIVWEESSSQCRANKTRTCILFDEHKVFSKFGYEAERKFNELLGSGKAENWYFFKNYKHFLNEPQIPEEITDICGKSMPFDNVFKETLRCLTSKVVHCIGQVSDKGILWIITAPSDKPLNYLEKISSQIGINRHNMILETEDAVLSMTALRYIKNAQQSEIRDGWKAGQTCILLDLGGSVKMVEYKISITECDDFELIPFESQKLIQNFNRGTFTESDGAFTSESKLTLKMKEIFQLLCNSEKAMCESSVDEEARSRKPESLRIIAKSALFYVHATAVFEKSETLKQKPRALLLCGGHSENHLFANRILKDLRNLRYNTEKLNTYTLREGSLAVLEGAILLALAKTKYQQKSKYLVAAAIDIGTAYSGFVFSNVSDFMQDPLKTNSDTWLDTYNGGMTSKTSTCILFCPKEKFIAFGFDAEKKYYEDLDDNSRKEWLFFELFKMELYKTENLDTLLLVSKCGKSMKAKTVFAEAIRYMKTRLVKLYDTNHGSSIDISEIKWIITVPAIWSNSAKSFMREAAVEAGIASEDLVIALEPEAAAVFVQHLPCDRSVDKMALQRFPRGLKYLVIDAGGGTVDITAHEVIDESGHVKEILSPSGGAWGGSNVDSEFLRFLFKVLGWTNDSSKGKYAEAIFDVQKQFGNKKRLIDPNKRENITITLPQQLSEILKKKYKNKKGNSVKITFGREEIEFSLPNNKIRLESKCTEIFFQSSIDGICQHLQSLFQKECALDINTILIVGGFAASPVLQNAVRAKFPSKRVISPLDSIWAVLGGAVIYGHDPTLIKQRKSKYTYGIVCSRIFDPAVHDQKYKFVKDGKVRCNSLFSKHVTIDDLLTVGEYQSDISYALLSDYDFSIGVYATTSPQPMYVTDEGCKMIGSLSLKDQIVDKSSSIRVQMSFSDTEIKVKLAYLKTAEFVEKYLKT